MAYEQAQIPVQKAEEFEQLRSAIERVFSSDTLTKFYRQLESKKLAARQFEKILERRLFEESDATLAGGGRSAEELYRSLSQSDQAMMREFYLGRIEKVDPGLRLKYRKLYEYR